MIIPKTSVSKKKIRLDKINCLMESACVESASKAKLGEIQNINIFIRIEPQNLKLPP